MTVKTNAGARVTGPLKAKADTLNASTLPQRQDHEVLLPPPCTWMEIVPGSPWCRPWWRWDLARWSLRERRDPPAEFAGEWVDTARQLLLDPALVPEPARRAL